MWYIVGEKTPCRKMTTVPMAGADGREPTNKTKEIQP